MNGKQFIKICGVIAGLAAAGYTAYSQYKKQKETVIIVENEALEDQLKDEPRE